MTDETKVPRYVLLDREEGPADAWEPEAYPEVYELWCDSGDVAKLEAENARLRAQKQSLSMALRRLHDLDWKDAVRAFGTKEYAAFADAIVGAAKALEETDD